MKLLAIDTSTAQLCVGVRHAEQWQQDVSRGGAAHARELPQRVSRQLEIVGLRPRDLDAIIVGVGPGSFAGLRIGMGFAQSMAWALDCPLVPVGSLEAVADAAFATIDPPQCVWSVLDARMGAVYVAAFEREASGDVTDCGPAREVRAAAFFAELREQQASDPESCRGVWLAGDGLALTEAMDLDTGCWHGRDEAALPRPESYLRLGSVRLEAGKTVSARALRPLYVRDRVALTRAQRAAGEQLIQD